MCVWRKRVVDELRDLGPWKPSVALDWWRIETREWDAKPETEGGRRLRHWSDTEDIKGKRKSEALPSAVWTTVTNEKPSVIVKDQATGPLSETLRFCSKGQRETLMDTGLHGRTLILDSLQSLRIYLPRQQMRWLNRTCLYVTKNEVANLLQCLKRCHSNWKIITSALMLTMWILNDSSNNFA